VSGRDEPLGLLGGTFDPVHYGHLRLAEEAREALDLAGVRWIPAGRPPHRPAPRVAAAHRLEMVRQAVSGNPAFTVDDAETASGEPSYTVTTLERLRAEQGSRPLCC
jgi:nicotinate-nucleotide adenylyltransferase